MDENVELCSHNSSCPARRKWPCQISLPSASLTNGSSEVDCPLPTHSWKQQPVERAVVPGHSGLSIYWNSPNVSHCAKCKFQYYASINVAIPPASFQFWWSEGRSWLSEKEVKSERWGAHDLCQGQPHHLHGLLMTRWQVLCLRYCGSIPLWCKSHVTFACTLPLLDMHEKMSEDKSKALGGSVTQPLEETLQSKSETSTESEQTTISRSCEFYFIPPILESWLYGLCTAENWTVLKSACGPVLWTASW